MGRLVYSAIVSLDGFVEDADGDFDALEPPDDVHRAANELALRASAFLFGRRLFEVMEEPWTELASRDDVPSPGKEFAAAYVATPRYAFSDTLTKVPAGVTLVRSADAKADVTRLKSDLDGVLVIGGATLAASLVDLLDEVELHVLPVLLGGGKPFLVAGRQLPLRLVEQEAYPSGAVHLSYERVR